MAPSYFSVYEHVVPCQYIREYPAAIMRDQEETLHMHVKQYTPKDRLRVTPSAVTIIGAHANAFPKVSLIVRLLLSNQYLSIAGVI